MDQITIFTSFAAGLISLLSPDPCRRSRDCQHQGNGHGRHVSAGGLSAGSWDTIFDDLHGVESLSPVLQPLQTTLLCGENRGRKLAHTAVVRKLTQIGRLAQASSFTAAPVVRVVRQWKAKDLRAIAFVQAKTDRRILAVSSIPIEGLK